MIEWMWFGIVFLGVFGASFGLISFVANRRERERQRLAQGAEPDSSADIFLGEAGPVLAQQLPMGQEKRTEIRDELIAAGYYSPHAVTQYAAVRNVLIVLPLLITGVVALLVDRTWIPTVVLVGVIVAGLGYSLPRVYLVVVGRRRRREIEKGLPVAVDMLALALLGGQTIPNALRRVTQELKGSFPVLAGEMEIVREQASLNTLPHALAQFADRVRLADVRNLAVLLSQAERQGTDIAAALMEFATTFRASLRQRADRQANQASFWLVFPCVVFLWAPAFSILLAPIVFEFQKKRNEGRELQERTRQMNERRNAPPPPGPGEQPTE